MAGDLQPLVSNQQIVNPDGTPTQYFTRWAQQRQIDIGDAPSLDDVNARIAELFAARHVNTGTGLKGGGALDHDLTLSLDAGLVNLKDVDFSTAPADKQVLTFDAAAKTWKPKAGGGGGGSSAGAQVLISDNTYPSATNDVIIPFNTATYVDFVIEVTRFVADVDNTVLTFTASVDGGATFDASSSYRNATFQSNTGTFSSTLNLGNTSPYGALGWSDTLGINTAYAVFARFLDPAWAAGNKSVQVQQSGVANDGGYYNRIGAVGYLNNAAYNAIRLRGLSASNGAAVTWAGRIRVYGILKATSGGGGSGGSGGDLVTGWRQTDDGFIEQWGQCLAGQRNINFSIPFTQGVINILGVCNDGANVANLLYGFFTRNVTLTGFTSYAYAYNGSGGPFQPGETYRWIAKGK